MSSETYAALALWLCNRPASPALLAALPAAARMRKGAARVDAAAALLATLPADDHLHRVAAVLKRHG